MLSLEPYLKDKLKVLVQSQEHVQAFVENSKQGRYVRSYSFIDFPDKKFLLVCTSIVSAEMINSLELVHKAFQEQEQLKLFNKPLRSGYLVTLALITALVIFAAIWIAFYIAKDLSGPIAELLEGTKAIAAGKYSHKIKVHGNDELSLLSKAFNQMSSDLYLSTKDIFAHKQFIEAIQAQLAVGVVVISNDNKITSINSAALYIFAKPEDDNYIANSLEEFLPESAYQEVLDLLHKLATESKQNSLQQVKQREQILKFKIQHDDRRVLCTAGIMDNQLMGSGYLLLFDDVTDLVKAQEVVAWREVARRIAHEIKNPLTPLQLTVQRLQKALPKEDTALAKLGDTILEHVYSIKRLADEFSRFARMPTISCAQHNINDLLSDIISEFVDRNPDIIFQFLPDGEAGELSIDREQIRRAVYNILDNAVNAFLDKPSERSSKIILRTKKSENSVIIEISDNGPGIAKEDIDRIFEPYFTKALGGTGLGLSIVAGVIREHNGSILVDRTYSHGAKFIIELPLVGGEGTKRRIVETVGGR